MKALQNVWAFLKDLGVPFAAALQFLTIALPPVGRSFSAREMGRGAACFPLAGLALGAVLAGADFLLKDIWHGNGLQIAMVLSLWVVLTGALHLDGFLDSCDGLLGGHNAEERLNIMRDPRAGSFAVVGGVLLLLLKFTALQTVHHRWAALLLAPTLGRWCVSWALIGFPYARAEGLGRVLKDNATYFELYLATIIAGTTVAVMVFFCGPFVVLLMGATFLATWLLARWTMTRIPGLTGDVYGAICESMELLVLVLTALPFFG